MSTPQWNDPNQQTAPTPPPAQPAQPGQPWAPPPAQDPWAAAPGGRPAATMEGDDRVAAILAHLSAPAAFVLSAGSLSVLGPLAVWFLLKDRSPAVRRAAASAFNFNVAAWVAYLVGWVLVFTLIGLPIALLLWTVVFLMSAWCHVRGALAASRGEVYDYPFEIPILR